MPLDPEIAAMLADQPRYWHDVEQLTVPGARAWVDASYGDRTTAGLSFRDIEVPGSAGPLRVRLHAPSDVDPAGLVVWYRGGGFVLGTLDQASELVAGIAEASGCLIASVDYPVAPEHPFPVPVEESYRALVWLADHAAELTGSDAVAVAGESAGGNLAAAVTLMARDRQGPDLLHQALIYPMAAPHFDGESRHDPECGAQAPWGAMAWLWDIYLDGADAADPRVAPLHAPSLAGLPPATVITAQYDPLRDEGNAYANRLRAEGVPVRNECFSSMPHGFASLAHLGPAQRCRQMVGDALRSALLRDAVAPQA